MYHLQIRETLRSPLKIVAPTYNADTGGDQIVAHFAGEVKGRVFLITGASPNGLGEFFAKASPKLIIFAARNAEKGEVTASSIKGINSAVQTRVLHLDLTTFASIRKAAQEVNSYAENINVLVNNTGIMAVLYSKTKEGHESHWQSNCLSHFLFTNLIIDKILHSGPTSRAVNIRSGGYRLGGTANILFTAELARRLAGKGLVAVALSPGNVYANLATHGATGKFDDLWALCRKIEDSLGWRQPNPLDPNHGVANHAYAALAPAFKDFNGDYMCSLEELPDPIEEMSPWAVGELKGKKSWELSEKLVEQKFDFK
ncbi:short-chain dehydrogenase/ reductase [Nemania abortiva]|nr:short-chain dehydrogenase/ reductase [Nemania abortiva]